MNLSRFTQLGMYQFTQYLDGLQEDPKSKFPGGLLDQHQYAEVVNDELEMAVHAFRTRLEAARYMNSLISNADLQDAERDVPLWTWLTAYYFDAVCPKDADGNRHMRERAVYVPDPGNYRRYYRHALLGSYVIYRANLDNPDRAMAFLCKPPHILTDIEGQIAATQRLVNNQSVVELTTRLYYDPKKKDTKPGAGGKGEGSPRRLRQILNQYELTWDLYSATTDELQELLPTEFEKYLTS